MRRTLLLAAALLAALTLAPWSALAQAHAHVNHVAKSWQGTPGDVGLLEALQLEAKVAAQHAGFAASKPDDLAWMQMHVHHVRHAIDPTTESGGPGKGYGVLASARGVVKHIGLAADSPDASGNVKTHARHIATAAGNVVDWAAAVMALSQQVLDATSAADAAEPTRRIAALTGQIMEGTGDKSWRNGGVAQARQHLGFLLQGEGMQ